MKTNDTSLPPREMYEGIREFRVLDGVAMDPQNGNRVFYTKVVELPLDLSLDPNAREGHLGTPISRQIRATLTTEGVAMSRRSGGLTVVADSASYDPGTGILEVAFKRGHGVVDGGSTYRNYQAVRTQVVDRLGMLLANPKADQEHIVTLQQQLDQLKQATVRVEVICGLTSDQVQDTSVARNSTNKVKDVSQLDNAGAFDPIKKIIGQSLAMRTMWHENQVEEKDVAREIDGKFWAKLVYCYSSLDPKFNPKAIYGGAYLKHFHDHYDSDEYLEATAMIVDLAHFYEEIYAAISKRQRTDGYLRAGISARVHVLPVTQKKVSFFVPEPYIFAVLNGMKAILNKDHTWRRNPQNFLRAHKSEMIDSIFEFHDSLSRDQQTSTKFGQNAQLYKTLLTQAELMTFKSKPDDEAESAAR